MKITVELPDEEMAEICRITGIPKKGPAIRKLLSETLQSQRRTQIARKFLTGEWGTDLGDFEDARKADRTTSQSLSEQWRD